MLLDPVPHSQYRSGSWTAKSMRIQIRIRNSSLHSGISALDEMRVETNRETVTANGAGFYKFSKILCCFKNAERVTNLDCCHANQSHELESACVGWGREGQARV